EELRELRKLVGQPLPDLITEVERTLGLDIEVGARPGRDPLSARADLDAFVDHAVRFVGNSEDPTLGSFLSYLNAAAERESGLAPGERAGGNDTVKLMTMHAAKGLQWPVVVVPGISGGGNAPVFPTRLPPGDMWIQGEHLIPRSEEHTSELQSRFDLVCRLLLEKKKLLVATVPVAQPTRIHRLYISLIQ